MSGVLKNVYQTSSDALDTTLLFFMLSVDDHGFTYANLTDLLRSAAYKRIDITNLGIDKTLIEQLALRHSTDYVTRELLWKLPITLFLSRDDKTQILVDGQHRISGAYTLGLDKIPCKLVPYGLWSRFINYQRISGHKEFGTTQPRTFTFERNRPKLSNAGANFGDL